MIRMVQKPLSLIVGFSLLLQMGLAPWAEAHIWSERRVTLAALPSPSGPSLMPLISPEKNSFLLHDKGRLQESFKGTSSTQKPWLILQDVHLHEEAQHHLASLLIHWIDQDQVDVIGVEGAFTKFDFLPFRQYSDQNRMKEGAHQFLKRKLMAAPSFAGLLSKKNPPLIMGVDEDHHHSLHEQAVRDALTSKPEILKKMTHWKQYLQIEKNKHFTPTLLQFDSIRNQFHQGNIPLSQFLKDLTSWQEKIPPTLQKFQQAFQIETNLNFPKVQKNQQQLIHQLSPLLSETDLASLVQQSLALRQGRLNMADYYTHFLSLLSHYGLDLKNFPHLNRYIQYVLLSHQIDETQIFKELHQLEQTVAQKLARTPEQKQLTKESERFLLTRKLVQFELIPEEWERYKKIHQGKPSIKNREKPNAYSSPPREGRGQGWGQAPEELAFLKEKSLRVVLNPSPSPHGEGNCCSWGPSPSQDEEKFLMLLRPFEQFYHQADIRSEKMFQNLKALEGERKVLVTGGFHTQELTRKLKQENIPYKVISPKITSLETDSGTAYLSLYSQEKTPLDKLISGDKLFLTPRSVHLTYPKLLQAFRQHLGMPIKNSTQKASSQKLATQILPFLIVETLVLGLFRQAEGFSLIHLTLVTLIFFAVHVVSYMVFAQTSFRHAFLEKSPILLWSIPYIFLALFVPNVFAALGSSGLVHGVINVLALTGWIPLGALGRTKPIFQDTHQNTGLFHPERKTTGHFRARIDIGPYRIRSPKESHDSFEIIGVEDTKDWRFEQKKYQRRKGLFSKRKEKRRSVYFL